MGSGYVSCVTEKMLEYLSSEDVHGWEWWGLKCPGQLARTPSGILIDLGDLNSVTSVTHCLILLSRVAEK